MLTGLTPRREKKRRQVLPQPCLKTGEGREFRKQAFQKAPVLPCRTCALQ
jgi:hypothetical protein